MRKLGPGLATKSEGFSLIELMIVVAVVGVLAAIVVPSYGEYIRRTKLTDGTAVLGEYRIRLEQYYQDNRGYGPVAGGACGVVPPTPSQTVSHAFSYVCTVGGTRDAYTATASNVAGVGLGSVGDYTYTLTEQNVRATTKFKGAPPSPAAACWLIKSSSC